MNSEPMQCQLRALGGAHFVLERVDISATLRDSMLTVEVEQHFRNPQPTNVEAVYTFPLPYDAVLLKLSVTLGERCLEGVVVEKQEAENRYEDAVSDGDSAFLLQRAGHDGHYTLNLGNLMAGESATIKFRYALLTAWRGDRLRLLLPSALAPRYGDPVNQGRLMPHQVPQTTLAASYPLTLSLTVEGLLSRSRVSSPSHQLAVQASGLGLHVELAEKAVLDRDLVLTFEAEGVPEGAAVVAQDESEHVVMLTYRPGRPDHVQSRPLSLKLLLDCSGSMAGDSFAVALEGLQEVLNKLRGDDEVSLTLFGSSYRHLFDRTKRANEYNLHKLRTQLIGLDATMGGTEMERALEAVLALPSSGECSDILLITDGEIWDVDHLIDRAKQSGHRVFAIGIGSAVAEGFLRRLAESTGGALELIAPREQVGDRIVAQFHRLRERRADVLEIRWPAEPLWRTTVPTATYSGDTLHCFAGFDRPVSGELRVAARYGEAELAACVTLEPASSLWSDDLPRLAAARRLAELSGDDALQLALRHQLVTDRTHCLVVAHRADGEKAAMMPQLHVVPQMLATGWGGAGSVDRPRPGLMLRRRSANSSMLPAYRCFIEPVGLERQERDDLFDSLLDSSLQIAGASTSTRGHLEPLAFVVAIMNELDVGQPVQLPILLNVFNNLKDDLPNEVREGLELAVSAGWSEAAVAAVFIEAMLDSFPSSFGPIGIHPSVLLSGFAALALPDDLSKHVRSCLSGTTVMIWCWNATLSLAVPLAVATVE